MTVLITGATGFLGRHVLQTMAAAGSAGRALALVRKRSEWEAMAWTQELGGVDTLEGTVTGLDSSHLPESVGRLTGILHLAAVVHHSRRGAEAMWQTNVEGTLNMVRLAAAHRCRMIFVSTSGVVGSFDTLAEAADEEAPFCEARVSRWPYYASKVAAEKAARALANDLGVELIFLRPPVLLGPGDHRFRSSSNIIRYLRRRLPVVFPGGMHFADIRDVSQAILTVLDHPSPRPIYHLPGAASELDTFFRWIAQAVGREPDWRTVPSRLAWGAAVLNQWLGSTLSFLPDPVVIEMGSSYWGLKSLYAAEELGYQSRPPQETLTDTIAWLQAEHPQLKVLAAGSPSTPLTTAADQRP
ncbi:MAG: NAD-dependent epimerase/dehydratase family protein [Candidatus Sericytochromatia bacterium]|nr:NAD-dependent epimerase/dehydratase family protein [Candidatus Sericytochromatia bacterium]